MSCLRSDAFKLVAVIDGLGEAATVDLYVERDGEVVLELDWPKDWPEKVSATFLRDHGFEVGSA
jgi:hypothetical protein